MPYKSTINKEKIKFKNENQEQNQQVAENIENVKPLEESVVENVEKQESKNKLFYNLIKIKLKKMNKM